MKVHYVKTEKFEYDQYTEWLFTCRECSFQTLYRVYKSTGQGIYKSISPGNPDVVHEDEPEEFIPVEESEFDRFVDSLSEPSRQFLERLAWD